MCLIKYHVLILCLLFFHTEALNCRSDGGPKESELKSIYNKCLKMQDGKNSSSSREYSAGRDWKDQDRQSDRNDWERNQSNDRGRSREERSGSRSSGRSSTDGRMGYDEHNGNTGSYDDSGSYGDRTSGYDRMGGYDDRMGSSSNRMGRYGGNDREDSMGNSDSRYGQDRNHNSRSDNDRNEDFGSDMSNQYGYQSSTQSSKRYKRERQTENSGQRSQFNPNSKRSSSYDDSKQNDDKNSKGNKTSKVDEKKACALHCFLENLEMTGEDGMPDRYLVTHTLTKDVSNEDLKDFLQESIEECFQILDNENTEDKCEFSKSLLMCLSEKGRANCDDWKDDLRF